MRLHAFVHLPSMSGLFVRIVGWCVICGAACQSKEHLDEKLHVAFCACPKIKWGETSVIHVDYCRTHNTCTRCKKHPCATLMLSLPPRGYFSPNCYRIFFPRRHEYPLRKENKGNDGIPRYSCKRLTLYIVLLYRHSSVQQFV